MATQHILSCSVAAETSFGSLDSATGIPSASGLLYTGLEMTRNGLVYWGDPLVDMREDETREGAFLPTPEPVTMRDTSGDYVQHREGDITLNVRMRSVGVLTGDYLNPLAMPWTKLLQSSMGYLANAAVATDTVAAAGTINTFDATTIASYSVGKMIAVVISGQLEISWVTGISTNTVTHSPAFSRALTSVGTADVVHICEEMFTSAALTKGDSVALRMTTLEGVVSAYGCRMSSAKITVTQKQAFLEVVLKSAHISDAHASSTPVAVGYSEGELPHFIGTYGVFTDAVDDTSPATNSRTVMSLDVDSLVINIETPLASGGYAGGLLATADYDVVDVKVGVEVTLGTPTTTLDRMLWDRETRGFHFGFGPHGAGCGMGLGLMAANATNDTSKRVFVDGTIRQQLMLRTAKYRGDNASSDIANSPFRIGLVKV